jgi:hypothetical protein
MSSVSRRVLKLAARSTSDQLAMFASHDFGWSDQLLSELGLGRDAGPCTVRAVPVERFVAVLQAHRGEAGVEDALTFISENYPYKPGSRLLVGLAADGIDARLVPVAS